MLLKEAPAGFDRAHVSGEDLKAYLDVETQKVEDWALKENLRSVGCGT